MSSTAERPRAKSLSPLRALLPFLWPYRGVAAAVIGMALYTGAIDPRAAAGEFGE